MGTQVELQTADGDSAFGVVRWLGHLHDQDEEAAGIELEEEKRGLSNGWYKGTQYFACPDRRAAFVPLTHIANDSRLINGDRNGDQDIRVAIQ